jgi:hypothetical protein
VRPRSAPQAVVSTLVPNVLAPPFWRFCRKLERKDCRDEVEFGELPVLPPRSPMSFSNAELRVDSVLDDKLDEGSVLLISWLLATSWTSTWSAEMMSCGPYDAAAEAPAVLELPALEAVGSVVDAVGADPDAAAADVAAVEGAAVAGAAVAGAAVAGAAVAGAAVDDSPESPWPAPPRWPRPDRPAWRSAPERSCRNARRSCARLSLGAPVAPLVEELAAVAEPAAEDEPAVEPLDAVPAEEPDRVVAA